MTQLVVIIDLGILTSHKLQARFGDQFAVFKPRSIQISLRTSRSLNTLNEVNAYASFKYVLSSYHRDSISELSDELI